MLIRKVMLLSLCTAWLAACAPTMPQVKPIRFNALTKGAMSARPVVIEVRKGDQLPVKVSLAGNPLESDAGAPPIVLTAKQRFFVVVPEHGPPRLSLDGISLGHVDKKGSLSVGLAQEPGGAPNITIELRQTYHSNN